MESDVQLIDVSKSYKSNDVVKSVNLDVKKGEFLTILGPSGVGKTTLLKIIAGFEKCNKGKIILNGNDITNLPPYKRNIGMLFQNYALFPHMTIFDNIAFPLKIRKMSKEKIKKKVFDILNRVRLSGFEKRYPRQLSGGQQQRVALARALVFNPPVLLLDEPMAALDKQLKKQMQTEIKQIQEDLGVTTISVTHDQEEALSMSSRVCVMHNGHISQIGRPKEIYNNPNNLFVAQFIGEANIIKGKVINIRDDIACINIFKNNTIYVNCKNKNLANGDELNIVIRPEKIKIVIGGNYAGCAFNAKIKEMIFIGEAIKIFVETESGNTLQIKCLTTENYQLKPNDLVRIGWDEKDMTLFKNEGGE